MNKIPTLYVRDMSKQPALVIDELNPAAAWVIADDGVYATRKYDGTSCLVRSGKLYKRRELRPGETPPPNFESLGTDENTGKTVGWVPVGDGPEDRWHREAFNGGEEDGTYELVGPKTQGNKDGFPSNQLIRHGVTRFDPEPPRSFVGLRNWLADNQIEGVVWYHPDGRMAKIKRRDFGLKW